MRPTPTAPDDQFCLTPEHRRCDQGSLRMPRMASQVLARGILPLARTLWLRRSICSAVSALWVSKAFLSSGDLVAFAIYNDGDHPLRDRFDSNLPRKAVPHGQGRCAIAYIYEPVTARSIAAASCACANGLPKRSRSSRPSPSGSSA